MKKMLFRISAMLAFVLMSLPSSAQYCTTGLYTNGCQFGDDLDNVTIGTYIEDSLGCTPGGYADLTGDTISISQTEVTAISITSNFSTQYYALWIDGNNDSDFVDAGEFIWNTTTSGNSATDQFIVPTTIPVGYHRMRLRGKYAGSAMTANDPCTSFTYGEVHDYIVEVLPPPPCPTPYSIVPTLVTSSTADLTFQGVGNKFIIEYGPCGFTQGTGQLDTVTATSVTLTGLAANTEYEVYVMNDCSAGGNGTSNWGKSACFKTNCNAQATPFTENFDLTAGGTTTNPNAPDCWEYVKTNNGGNGYGYTYANATYARSAPNSFRFYSGSNATSGDTMGLVSPQVLNMSTVDKRIEFWARSMYTGTAYDCKLVVGTMSSPSDISSFDPIDTIDLGDNVNYQYFVVNITAANGYNGNDEFIAIMDASDVYDYPMVDDITISNVPDCIPSQGLTFSNVSNNSVDLSWLAGQGIEYHIEYGPTGFTQGTGPIIKGITSPNYTLTGLAGNTCYDVYLRDSCSSGNNPLSPWFGPITVCTACDPIQTPIMEGFEGIPTGSTTDPSMPACWSYWTAPTTSGYGYTYGFTNPNSGSQHFRMYVFSSGNPGDTVSIISPAVDGLTNGDKLIKFYAKSGSTVGGADLIVGTSPSASDLRNATILDTIVTDGSAYGTEFSVYLDTASGYNGTDEYVFFMHGKSPTVTTLYLDDISIEDIPACAAPWNLDAKNVTATGADLEWYNLQGTTFQLEWGPQGFLPGTAGMGLGKNTSATSPTSISGLNPNTYYDFYVADNCDTTNFAGPFTFKTPCLGTLSGTYTVGGASADFATLDSAFTVLLGCGVSGPVTLNLQGGTFAVPGAYVSNNIAGVSATNDITINGGGPSMDTILFTGGAHGIDFDGGSHVNFNNLTLDGSNVTGRTVWMHNGATNISFDNCHIINGGSTSSTTGGIIASNTETSNFSAGDNASDISVTNCTFKGGYAGVIFYGQGTLARNSGFVVENNIFDGQYYYGIRFYYTEDIVMRNNENITPMNYPSYNYYVDDITIEGNKFNGTTYGLYLGYVNTYAQDTPAVKSIVRNNFITASGTYGAYCYSMGYVDYTHNTIVGTGTYGQYLSGTTTYEGREVTMVNNIFVGGSNYGLYGFPASFDSVYIDHNIYYSTTGSNVAYWNTAYATAAAWNTADGSNANSLDGDPGFVSPTDFHLLGGLANDEGVNGFATVDIDGDTRPASGSTNVDIGADEYTPVTDDLSLLNGGLYKNSHCLSASDSIYLDVQNAIGTTKNFATTNLVAKWTVTGPINSNGTITINTGTLAPMDTMTIFGIPVDLSTPGNYTLSAYLEPSATNLEATNDTLEAVNFTIYDDWNVTPDTVVVINNMIDSVEMEAMSPFLSGNTFFITEQCHFKTTNGAPSGGWPTYLTTDDYIEITGVPNSDLGGITLEQWNTTGMAGTYTFPQGTLLSPNGTAIIAVGQLGTSVPSPSDFYYHGNGTYTGLWSSSTAAGRILKDANGNIIDAVISNSFTWPAAAGVTAADWSGTVPGTGGTSGNRLNGPDNNTSSNWISSSTSAQDPNVLNANVPLPAASSTAGFAWTLNGNVIDTLPRTVVGPYTTGGVFNYVATYNGPCGVFTDTVVVIVNLTSCAIPANITGTAPACDSIEISWNQSADSSLVTYVATGGAPGAGTLVLNDSSYAVSGLMPNTDYDFYVANICGGDTTGWSPAYTINSGSAGSPAASFTSNAQVQFGFTYDFDASGTSGVGNSYDWDFGDGNTASGMMVSHTYTAGGTYDVKLTVTNACGEDSVTNTLNNVDIEESLLNQSLNVFPNPSVGNFAVDFQVEGLKDIKIRVVTLLGQEVYASNPGTISGDYRETIDLSDKAQGVYILQIQSDDDVVSRKLTIRR